MYVPQVMKRVTEDRATWHTAQDSKVPHRFVSEKRARGGLRHLRLWIIHSGPALFHCVTLVSGQESSTSHNLSISAS